jgi:class 3 adenylate cyclase
MSEERRVVTVLFSDVAGSTAMGESNDPEDVRALLARYYAIARDVISTHGGTVEKFIGDSVMAVFGIPQAHGDDAERALVAALALREAVGGDPQTAALVLRIGVNTGEVVAARQTDAGDFLVTGDAVNIAARLQQAAEPGSILVGDRTRRAASGFRFGTEQRLEVKGKREPIGAFALTERMVEGHAPRMPFLGREHDLAQLDLVSRRAFAECRPHLVTITAPAGTGKSRLVQEFAARMGNGARIATAQCLPYGSAVTFVPLRGLVADLVGAKREDEALQRVHSAFVEAGHPDGDARRLAALIAVTLGESTANERQDRDEIFTAWRLLIEAQAALGPLVVVFEDLHWATDTLLELVEHVTVSRMSTPLLMFALARPELLDRRPTWGGGRRNFASLGLEPLSDAETRGLLAGLSDHIPAAVADRIVERSGGNPFFAGELVRAYQERLDEGAAGAAVQLPDTVHATVLARIDKLPGDERLVLEMAAIAGRTARPATIGALLPALGEARIAAALDSLAERDMLVAQGAGDYTFRHIVIREVAYATLPRAERVRGHLRLASWLEETTRDRASEIAEVIAYHYRQAIGLSPGGRVPEGLDASVVVAALERAARAAAKASAYVEADELIRDAIRVAAPERHLDLLELRGDLLLFGDPALEGYAEAWERWRQSRAADSRVGARLIVKRLIVSSRWAGSLSSPIDEGEFRSLAEEAQRLLQHAPDPEVSAKLACALALQRGFARADSAAASQLRGAAERAAEFFAARGDIEGESEALDAVASIQRTEFGDWQGSIESTDRRLANDARLSLIERIDAWNVKVWSLVFAARYEDAVETFHESRRARHAGDPDYVLMHGAAWAALGAMLSGRWDEALSLGDMLLAMREEAQRTMTRFSFPGWVAVLRVAAARQDGTRLARYRSAFVATANFGTLREPLRSCWSAYIDRDAAAARRFLHAHQSLPDRKGELIAFLLFDLGERLDEGELAPLDSDASRVPPILELRVRLARALNVGSDELRAAITALDAAHHVADAARAAALLALRTRNEPDRADARRRLEALGDRLFLQKLEEEWT